MKDKGVNMREIEFRAWCHETKNISFSNDWETLAGFFGSIDLNIKNNKSFMIMQYTGLKDKNGKKIFEGDIVKIDYNTMKYGIIEFIDHGFWIKNGFGDHIMPYFQSMEIVGNIYENKEFLNVT
jgi:hypothetical protein